MTRLEALFYVVYYAFILLGGVYILYNWEDIFE